MRKTLLLCSAFGLLAAVSPAFVRAQFQPPNPDELKMTEDPKAPGAAAVYLDYEETDKSKEESTEYYARIKVLTEKGKEAATVAITYPAGELNIGSIRARTIHTDGTIVPLNVKPEDLLEVKSGDYRLQRKVFTLPSVEVGSILEFAYQVRGSWFGAGLVGSTKVLRSQGPLSVRAHRSGLRESDLVAESASRDKREEGRCGTIQPGYHRRSPGPRRRVDASDRHHPLQGAFLLCKPVPFARCGRLLEGGSARLVEGCGQIRRSNEDDPRRCEWSDRAQRQ